MMNGSDFDIEPNMGDAVLTNPQIGKTFISLGYRSNRSAEVFRAHDD